MIPRLAHRLWIGGPEPEWTRGFAETWRRPGWNLWQWDEKRLSVLPPLDNQDLYDAAPEIAPNHVEQFRSDLLRYELLYRFGGVWVDADFECLRPIDELIAGAEAFVVRVDDRWLNNAIMGAAPGHPFLRALIDHLPRSVRTHRGAAPRKLSGPQYLTPLHAKYGGGVRILDAEHFYPYRWDELERGGQEFPNAYAVHHWLNQRRERGLTGVPA